MDYRPAFSDQAITFFAALSRRRQRQLLDRSRELAASPGVKPDYWSKDADGNDIANLMVGGFLFAYWVDHAVKKVMIVEIDDAE